MDGQELDDVSEIYRAIDIYNEAIAEVQTHGASGEIHLASVPDDVQQLAETAQLVMQEKILELRQAGYHDIADRVNDCVMLIQDRKNRWE